MYEFFLYKNVASGFWPRLCSISGRSSSVLTASPAQIQIKVINCHFKMTTKWLPSVKWEYFVSSLKIHLEIIHELLIDYHEENCQHRGVA